MVTGIAVEVDSNRVSFRTTVDSAGRVVIPAEARRQLGIRVGDQVLVEADEAGVRILTLRQLVRRVQAAFAPYKRPGESVVAELIRERREEAEREDRES